MNLDSITRAVCRDLLAFPIPDVLTREQFVARYLPRYATPYEAPRGIRLRPDGRCTNPTRGNYRAQVTKREHAIDAAFAQYLSLHSSQKDFDARTGVSAS